MDNKKLQKLGKLNPRALIAGGAGYLGTNLSRVLLEAGFQVWVLDDFSSGKSSEFSNLCSHKNFRFWTADINRSFPQEVEESSLDFIFHIARLEVRDKDISPPLSTLVTNAIGTKNLLDLAKRKRARFLLGSSIGVGKSLEDGERTNPLLEAKRFAEALVSEYRDEFKLNARVARLAEIYGPGMDLLSSGSLGRLIKELLEEQELTVYGEGLGKEYYIYINDAVEGVCSAMFASGPQDQWEFVITPEDPVTTLELAYKVRDASALRIRLNFTNSPEPYTFHFKNPELQGVYPPSWEVRKDLDEGIEETLNYFRDSKKYQDLEGLEKIDKEKESPAEKASKKEGPSGKSDWFGFLSDISLGGVFAGFGDWLSGRGFGVVLAAVTLFLVLSIPLGQVLVFWARAQDQFSRADAGFKSFQLQKASNAAANAKDSTKVSERGLRRLSWVFNLIGHKDVYEHRMQSLRTLRYLSEYILYAAEAASPVVTVRDTQHIPSDSSELYSYQGALVRAQQMLLMTEAELARFSGSEDVIPLETSCEEYIDNSKGRIALLRRFLSDPASFSLDTLQQELEHHGWSFYE